MYKFSIIIPIFNEEDNIIKLINEIFFSLNSFKNYNFEIILVDDASTDNSLKIISELKKNNRNISFVSNNRNFGQSYSLREGIKISNFDTIVTLDGDGQNNPSDIPSLLEYYFLNDNISLVGGIRVKRKDNFIKRLSSILANSIRSKILKDNCIDTGCSLKVFDKEIFLKFPFFTGIHRFLPALFTGYNHKTFFINVDHRRRISGYSKYGTIDRLYKGVIDIIRVKKIIKKNKKNEL